MSSANDKMKEIQRSYYQKRRIDDKKKETKKEDDDEMKIGKKLSFKDVGGMDDILLSISRIIFHLFHPELFQHFNVKASSGILLHGPSGCGKTHLAMCIAGEFNLSFHRVDPTSIINGISGKSEKILRDLFDDAMKSSPSIIFIDEIDSITQSRNNSNRDMEKRIVSQLLTCFDRLNENYQHNVLIIGATNRIEAIDPALRSNGRFDREICIPIPTYEGRISLLKSITKDIPLSPQVDLHHLAYLLPGHVASDLKAIIRESVSSAIDRHLMEEIGDKDQLNSVMDLIQTKEKIDENILKQLNVTVNDIEKGIEIVQPTYKREGFVKLHDISWTNVGALDDIKEELRLSILIGTKNRPLYHKFGVRKSSGILLYGPPGCGKTLLAKAVANEAGISFVSVKGPEILNMYVGESEKAIREIFNRARYAVPCCLFFDEIDAICPKRSSSDSNQYQSRLVNQLLTEMDGMDCRQGIHIIAATNRRDIIDPAMLRPGRLDKTFYIGLPNEEDRVKILLAITNNRKKPPLHPEIDLKKIATETEGFSGADLDLLMRESSIIAIRELTKEEDQSDNDVSMIKIARRTSDSSNELFVTIDHLNEALTIVKASVSRKELKKYGNK